MRSFVLPGIFAWGQVEENQMDDIVGTLDGDLLFGTLEGELIEGLAGDDNIFAEDGDDTVFGGDGKDGIAGGIGNDTLFGDTGVDLLIGEDGDDSLFGGADDDHLFGFRGNDVLDGGAGNDTAFGGAGDDTVSGGAGDDFLRGDIGNDRLFGGNGNDRLGGGSGDDLLIGGNGDDSLFGDAGNDTLRGGNGDDQLRGAAGNDNFLGGSGSDRLFGGADNDVLNGQGGADDVFGGAGNDMLAISDADFSGDFYDGGADNDTLRVVLSDLDQAQTIANEAAVYLAGDTSQRFTFSNGFELVNVENIVVVSGGKVIEAVEEPEEPEQIIIDFQEFTPFGPSVQVAVPLADALQDTLVAEMIDFDRGFFPGGVETQGFFINVAPVPVFDRQMVDVVRVANDDGPLVEQNIVGVSAFPFNLLGGVGPIGVERGDLVEFDSVGPVEQPVLDPRFLEQVAFAIQEITVLLANVSDDLPDVADFVNSLLEDFEGLTIGGLLDIFQDDILALLDDFGALELLEEPIVQDVIDFVEVFTAEQLLTFGLQIAEEFLPPFGRPLHIEQIDGEVFDLEAADISIDAGFALALGRRDGEVVGVQLIQSPSPLAGRETFTLTGVDDNGQLPPVLGPFGPFGPPITPTTTVEFDDAEFGRIDAVDIISINAITIDNIVINEAYDVVDFENLDGPVGNEGRGAVFSEGFIFEGGIPVESPTLNFFEELSSFLNGPSISPIGGVGEPTGDAIVALETEGVGVNLPPGMADFQFNTGLLGGIPDFGVPDDLEGEQPIEDLPAIVISREDGADFDIVTALLDAEFGFVEAVAFSDGKEVGVQEFDTSIIFNAGTLVEFDADIFSGIDRLELYTDSQLVLDDIQFDNIGEPQTLV